MLDVFGFFPLSSSHEAEDTASPAQIMSHTDQRIKWQIIDKPLQLHTLSKGPFLNLIFPG